MNDYKEIRQRYLAGESQRHIAKAMGISRNTVAKYCEGEFVPWERKIPEREATKVTDEVTAFILSCIQEDEQVTFKKQKHTAKRIYDRLVAEKDFTGGESTIRRKVREIKATLPKAFIPLQFDPGDAIQIDWGEADIYEDGVKTRIYLFCARLCYSCRPVVLAYHRQNEESFCDAIVRTFDELGGVTKRVIFDNARVAVKKGFGSHAHMQDSYRFLSVHYGFEPIFCNPAQGHEKGLVEGLVGWARRNICVPVPRVSGIQELNQLLLARCQTYENHHVRDRQASVGVLFEKERASLLTLPKYKFETASCINGRVNAYATVRFKTNIYSVPVQYVGYTVSIKGYPESILIYHKGNLISTHQRLMGKNQTSYQLEHYMPLLEQRPRAILEAAPVKQNIPYEVLQELQQSKNTASNIIPILQYYSKKQSAKNDIKDVVTVKLVDLHQYDALYVGKEVMTHDQYHG